MSAELDQQTIAKRFSELPPDLAKWIGDVITEIGLRPWDELDPKTRRDVMQLARAAGQRLAEGRYTLEGATRLIVRYVAARAFASNRTEKLLTHWEQEWPTLSRLVSAAKAGDLPIFFPGIPLPHTPDNAPLTDWFSREACWNDLNPWLEANLPQLEYRFPSPERDAGDAGAAPVVVNTSSAETEPSTPVADPPNATLASADERVAERVASSANRGDQKDPLLFSPSLLLNRQAAALGVSVEELKAMFDTLSTPQIPASLRDVLATDPSFRRPLSAEEFVREPGTVTPIVSNGPAAASATGVGASADHPHTPVAANTPNAKTELSARGASCYADTAETAVVSVASGRAPIAEDESAVEKAATPRFRRGRTNILDPVIALAESAAIKSDNWQSVWAELVRLAQSDDRPAPLLGFVEGEGVKHQTQQGVEFFTATNLQDRFRRRARKQR